MNLQEKLNAAKMKILQNFEKAMNLWQKCEDCAEMYFQQVAKGLKLQASETSVIMMEHVLLACLVKWKDWPVCHL